MLDIPNAQIMKNTTISAQNQKNNEFRQRVLSSIKNAASLGEFSVEIEHGYQKSNDFFGRLVGDLYSSGYSVTQVHRYHIPTLVIKWG